MTRRSWGRAVVALLGVLLSLPSAASTQQISLPPDLQLGLIAKILTFDRQVSRYGPEIVIGVAFQPRNRESARARDEFVRTVEDAGSLQVAGMPLRIVDVPLAGDSLPPGLAGSVDVIYLTPVRGVDARDILGQALHMGLLTVTATPSEAGDGAAVALLVQDARPHIRIDLTAARSAGADLSSRLLRLAEVRQ
jgi:hypothetical protein